MHIIQLQAKLQNTRKTGVKRQIKCTINWTPNRQQGRCGRSRHTLAHYSITTVKSKHFTTVKRRSITVAQHQRIAALTYNILNYRKNFFKNMLTNNITSLYNIISSKVNINRGHT